EVADGAPSDVRLRHRAHLDGGEHAGGHARLLGGVLQRQCIDDGGEHAHVVAGGPLHPARAGGDAAEDIAAADDHRQLHPEIHHLADLVRDARDGLRIDTVPAAAREGLAGDLQQYSAVGGRHYPPSPTLNREKRFTTTRSPIFDVAWSTMSLIRVRPVASRTNGCSSRHCSAKNLSSLPSMILSSTCGGFFWSAIWSR